MKRIVMAALLMTSMAATAQDAKKPAGDGPAVSDPVRRDQVKEKREIEIVEPGDGGSGGRSVRLTSDDELRTDGDRGTTELSLVMDKSLEFNPEIQAIRAEIAALVARLRQLEMKTATDVARKSTELKRLKVKRDKDAALVEKQMKSPEELAELDAEIAAHDMELKYLVGVPGMDGEIREMRILRGDGPMLVGLGSPRPGLEEIADKKVRDVLENPFTANFENAKLDEVVNFVKEVYEVNFNVDVSVHDIPITIDVKNVKLRDLLVALSDANPDLAFIMRDYGIFVTTRDRAAGIAGPSIPEGVPYRGGAVAGRRLVGWPPEQADRVLDFVEKKRPETPAPATPAPKSK